MFLTNLSCFVKWLCLISLQFFPVKIKVAVDLGCVNVRHKVQNSLFQPLSGFTAISNHYTNMARIGPPQHCLDQFLINHNQRIAFLICLVYRLRPKWFTFISFPSTPAIQLTWFHKANLDVDSGHLSYFCCLLHNYIRKCKKSFRFKAQLK